MPEPFDDTTKDFYRTLFQGWGLRATTQFEVFSHARSIGLVVECTPTNQAAVEQTVFSHFRTLNALELKGPNDPLDLEDFNRIMMRGWGLGAMEPRPKSAEPPGSQPRVSVEAGVIAHPMNRSVTIVCVTRPDKILADPHLKFEKTEEDGIYLCPGPLQCWLIVPSELALTTRNYPLLPLARGMKLDDFIELCTEEGENDYLRLVMDIGAETGDLAVWDKILELFNMKPQPGSEVMGIINEIVERYHDRLPWVQTQLDEARKEADAKTHEIEMRVRQETETRVRQETETRVRQETEAKMREEAARVRQEMEARMREEAARVRKDDLLRQLRHKFGAIPPEVITQIEASSDVQRLNEWMERILDVNSLSEMGFQTNAS